MIIYSSYVSMHILGSVRQQAYGYLQDLMGSCYLISQKVTITDLLFECSSAFCGGWQGIQGELLQVLLISIELRMT